MEAYVVKVILFCALFGPLTSWGTIADVASSQADYMRVVEQFENAQSITQTELTEVIAQAQLKCTEFHKHNQTHISANKQVIENYYDVRAYTSQNMPIDPLGPNTNFRYTQNEVEVIFIRQTRATSHICVKIYRCEIVKD